MQILILIIGMAIVTYIPRAIPAVVIDKMKFGRRVEKFLSLIPYTAMAALIFPGVLSVDPEMKSIGIVGGLVAVVLSFIKAPITLVIIGAVLADVIIYLMA